MRAALAKVDPADARRLVEDLLSIAGITAVGGRSAAEIADLTHRIARCTPCEAGFWLARSYRYFPTGSVHVAVVDPGVGSGRRALLVEAAGHRFVGPDNGLLAEDWGGEVIVVPVSARTKLGLDLLLENIALQAEVLELKANPKAEASGVIIESEIARMVKDAKPGDSAEDIIRAALKSALRS